MPQRSPVCRQAEADQLEVPRAGPDDLASDRRARPPGHDGSRKSVARGGASSLSHELRTPLNAILGGVELLLDGSAGPMSEQARACLGDIQQAGRQLMGDVEDLLLLAQLRRTAADDEPELLDLIALLREAHAEALGPGRALQVRPREARLVVRGTLRGLRTLASALIGLQSLKPDVGAISIRVDQRARQIRMEVLWANSAELRHAAVRLALIEALGELHGASIAPSQRGGLSLIWPIPQLA